MTRMALPDRAGRQDARSAPAAAKGLNERALAALAGGRLEEAERFLRAALDAMPDDAGIHLNYGALCRKRGNVEGAFEHYRRALALKPGYALAYFNLGNLLRDAGRGEEAVAAYREALRAEPDYFDAELNLGNTLHDLARLDDAEEALRTALALRPGEAHVHTNLGNLLRAKGRIAEALDCYDRALALDPDCAETPLARAIALLLVGDFARGWPAYEGRWKEKAQRANWRRFEAPRWEGEPLAGKRILVYGEQGPGDIVMFASCLPELIARGAHVEVQCRGSVAPLLARSFPGARVETDRMPETGAWRPEPAADFVVPIGSLPRVFRPDAASFRRTPRRYLAPDPGSAARWRRRMDELGPGLKVGISWRGGASVLERRQRTMALADWLPVLSCRGATFVTLQYGECEDEIRALAEASGIVVHDWPDADPSRDLDGLAAEIDALDLVVSVANTTVHFAGALGKPTYALVPAAPSWRWMLKGRGCLWYPSVELIRQEPGAGWSGAIAAAARAVERRIADREAGERSQP